MRTAPPGSPFSFCFLFFFLFRHDTPKYGLIYHASLVGQAPPKLKGKVSRTLAAKTALSIRVDALGECDGVTIGFEGKEKVELRLKQLETGTNQKSSSSAVKAKPAQEKYNKPDAASVNTTTRTARPLSPPPFFLADDDQSISNSLQSYPNANCG